MSGAWDCQDLVLEGHTEEIIALVFSDDARTLASASWDATIKLWDTLTGQEKHTLADHTKEVTALAFTADGRFLASASWDGRLIIWDTATGTKLHEMSDVALGIKALNFSDDGSIIAAATTDVVTVMRVSNGETSSFNVAGQYVSNVVPDGPDHILVFTSKQMSCELHDSTTGRTTQCSCLDGREPDAVVVMTNTGEIMTETHVEAVALLGRRQKLAMALPDGTIRVSDGAPFQVMTLFTESYPGPYKSMRFSVDGQQFAILDQLEDMLEIWNLQTRTQVKEIMLSSSDASQDDYDNDCPKTVKFFDGRVLATTSAAEDIVLWDVQSGQAKFTTECPLLSEGCSAISGNSDGVVLLATSWGGTVTLRRVFSTETIR